MDLEKFSKEANRDKEMLTLFLQKFDEIVPPDLSEIVEEEDKKVWQNVDCTVCANCCKTMTPIFSEEDIARISLYLNISPSEFFDQYLEIEEDTGSTVNRVLPCVFLVDNKCSIYDVRPIDCAEFPHHNKRPFDDYNDTFIQNIFRCPATYELVKKLKTRIEEEYDF